MAISKHMLRMVDENEKFTNNPKHMLAYVQVEACLWSFGSYYPVYFLFLGTENLKTQKSQGARKHSHQYTNTILCLPVFGNKYEKFWKLNSKFKNMSSITCTTVQQKWQTDREKTHKKQIVSLQDSKSNLTKYSLYLNTQSIVCFCLRFFLLFRLIGFFQVIIQC